MKKAFFQALGFVGIFLIVLLLFNIRSFAFDTNTDNVDWSRCPEYDEKEYENCDSRIHNFWDPSISGNGKNIAHVTYRTADANNKALSINYVSFTYDGDLEDSLLYFYFNSYTGNEVLGIQNRANTNIIWQMKGYYSYNWSDAVYTNNSPSFSKSVNCNISAIPHVEIIYSDVDVADFHNVSNVNTAISSYFNGDKSNIIASKDDFGTKYDGETLKLKSYNVKYVDSDKLSEVYTDFKYSFPDDLDMRGVYLDVDTTYKIILQNNIAFVDVGMPDKVYIKSTKSDFIIYPAGSTGGLGASAGTNSYRSYVKDLTPIKDYQSDLNWWNTWLYDVNQKDREILGSSKWFVTNLDGYTYKTTFSQITYKVTVCKDNTRGKSYYFTFDLLGGMSGHFTTNPDNKGNETYNEDLTYTGNYFAKDTIDSMGNSHKEYTYTPPNNDVTVKIDTTTGQPSNPSDPVVSTFPSEIKLYLYDNDFDNYYTVSPTDFNTVVDNLKDLTNVSEENHDTYGFLHDVINVFPSQIWALIGGGLAVVFAVSIIRILRG